MKKLSLVLIVFLSSCMAGRMAPNIGPVIKADYSIIVSEAITESNSDWTKNVLTSKSGSGAYIVNLGSSYSNLQVTFKVTKEKANELLSRSNAFNFVLEESSNDAVFQITPGANGCENKKIVVGESCFIKVNVMYSGGATDKNQSDFLLFSLKENVETMYEEAVSFEVELALHRKVASVVKFSAPDFLDFGDLGYFDERSNSNLDNAGISYTIDGEIDVLTQGYEIVNNDNTGQALAGSCSGDSRNKTCSVTFNAKKGVGHNFTNSPATLKLSVALENGDTVEKNITIKGKRKTAPNIVVTPSDFYFDLTKTVQSFIVKNEGETAVTLSNCELSLPASYPAGLFTVANISVCNGRTLAKSQSFNLVVNFISANAVPPLSYTGGKLFINTSEHNDILGKYIDITGGVNSPAVLSLKKDGTTYLNDSTFLFDSTLIGKSLPLSFNIIKTGQINASDLFYASTGNFSYNISGIDCSTIVKNSTTCTVSLTFTPLDPKALKEGNFEISYNDDGDASTPKLTYVLNLEDRL